MQLSSSGCVWLPEQLLTVGGTDGSSSKNVCEGRWGRIGELGGKLPTLQLSLSVSWAELDIEDFKGPLPLPFCSLWVEHEISQPLPLEAEHGLRTLYFTFETN